MRAWDGGYIELLAYVFVAIETPCHTCVCFFVILIVVVMANVLTHWLSFHHAACRLLLGTEEIIGIAIGGGVAVIVLVAMVTLSVVLCYWWHKRKKKTEVSGLESGR